MNRIKRVRDKVEIYFSIVFFFSLATLIAHRSIAIEKNAWCIHFSFFRFGSFFHPLIWYCYCRLIMLIANSEIPKTNESVCQPQFWNCWVWLIFHGNEQTNQPTEFIFFFFWPIRQKRQQQKPNWSHFLYKIRWTVEFVLLHWPGLLLRSKHPTTEKKTDYVQGMRDYFIIFFVDSFDLI